MTLKLLFASATLMLTSWIVPADAENHKVGIMNFTFNAPHRERLVQSTLFYPAKGGGTIESVGDNIVFQGERMQRDALPEPKKHPLVIVSHGSGGNAARISWLARHLAEQGFVVAIPNHQGSTSGDSTPETTIPAMWLRPADLSRMLDAMTQTQSVSAFVETSDVTALGFSLGGAVVLNLAGAEFRANKLADFCNAEPESIGCPWLARGNALIPGNVDLHKIDASKFNSAYTDKRIKQVIAIDPGFVPALDTESLSNIAIPLQIINLGGFADMPTGLRADHVAKALARGTYATVVGASHFDFLPECKMLGWFYVWMEGDDPVCSKSNNRSRTDIHAEVANLVLGFLKEGKAAVDPAANVH